MAKTTKPAVEMTSTGALASAATAGTTTMTVQDIAARVKRLDALARGLAKELAEVRGNTVTVLLYRERRGYLEALANALDGVESARIVLARARRRLEG
jgi:hypothetical protein